MRGMKGVPVSVADWYTSFHGRQWTLENTWELNPATNQIESSILGLHYVKSTLYKSSSHHCDQVARVHLMTTIQTDNAMQEIMFENLDAKQLPVIAWGKQRERHPEGLAIRHRGHTNMNGAARHAICCIPFIISLSNVHFYHTPSIYIMSNSEKKYKHYDWAQ